MTPQQAATLGRSDRSRLILMSIAFVVLVLGYAYSSMTGKKYEQENVAELQSQLPEEVQEAAIYVPEFDMQEVLSNIQDARPEDRVSLDSEVLDVVFDFGRLMTSQHYSAMDIREIDAAVRAELYADPEAQRVKAFRSRGEVVEIRSRARVAKIPQEWVGILRGEDGEHVHFIAMHVPEGTEAGSYLRMDGVFLKLYSREVGGELLDGPLIVGNRAYKAYSSKAREGALEEALAAVRDDSFADRSDIPFDAKWELMRLAAKGDGAQATTDWDNAPELSSELLNQIFHDGDAYRGKPFRLGISRNMQGWVKAPGENPLQLTKVTTGWIGNMTWKGEVAAIHYVIPTENADLLDWEGKARLVTGRGYFLKNWMYERVGGKPGKVPFFVMESVDIFTPPDSSMSAAFLWSIVGGTCVMVILIFVLLKRDRKQATVLREELVRRRRARRAKTTEQPAV